MLLEKENKNTKVIYKADEVISEMYDRMKSVVVAPINGDTIGKKSIVQLVDFTGNVHLVKVKNDKKYNLVIAFVLNTAYENLKYHEFKVMHRTHSMVMKYYKDLGLVDQKFVIEDKSPRHVIVDTSSQQLNVLSEKFNMLTHKDCETPVSKKRYVKFIGTDGKVYYVFNAVRHRKIISILHSMNCVWEIDTEITDTMYSNVIATYAQLGIDISDKDNDEECEMNEDVVENIVVDEVDNTSSEEGKWSAGDLKFYTKSELYISEFYYDILVELGWLSDDQDIASKLHKQYFGTPTKIVNMIDSLNSRIYNHIEDEVGRLLTKTPKDHNTEVVIDSYRDEFINISPSSYTGRELTDKTLIYYYNGKRLVSTSFDEFGLGAERIKFGILIGLLTLDHNTPLKYSELYKRYLPTNIDCEVKRHHIELIINSVQVERIITSAKKHLKLDIIEKIKCHDDKDEKSKAILLRNVETEQPEYEKRDTRPIPIDHMDGDYFNQILKISTPLIPPNGFKVKCSHFVMCDGKPMSTVNTKTRQCNSCKSALTYEECCEVANSVNRITTCQHVITDDSGTIFWNVTSDGRCRACGANVQQIILMKTYPPQKTKEPEVHSQPITRPQLWTDYSKK